MDYNFRTLNYIGSKLRLLDFIQDKVFSLTREGQGVCDLFAGSGCVSYKLSKFFDVTCCDIQGYSKIICDTLLKKITVSNKDIEDFITTISLNSTLYKCFLPLIMIEEEAISNKNIEILTEIIENGSVEVFHLEERKTLLSDKLNEVYLNLEKNNLINNRSLISRYYGGVYFSYRQAVIIDVILEQIHSIVRTDLRNFYLAGLLSTSSDIVGTVGKQFAQPIKARDSKGNIKITVYNKAKKDKTIDIIELYKEWLFRYKSLPKSNHNFNIIQGDFLECLKNLPDCVKTVYADPPYTRDHYSRFYHVLETITLRDSPELSTSNVHGKIQISNGLYRKDRHQSPFCIKSKAPHAFRSMFEIISKGGKNLLLSYSPYDKTIKTHPRVVTMEQLLEWAKKYFSNVKVVSAGTFKHNKLNSTEHFLNASSEAEVLIICTNEPR